MIERRLALIAVAVAAVFALMFTALASRKPTDGGLFAEAAQPCMDQGTTDRVRALMLKGADQALENHFIHLFEIWMKDYRSTGPNRAAGMQQGVSAYMRSRNSVLNWQPPCLL